MGRRKPAHLHRKPKWSARGLYSSANLQLRLAEPACYESCPTRDQLHMVDVIVKQIRLRWLESGFRTKRQQQCSCVELHVGIGPERLTRGSRRHWRAGRGDT